MEIPERIKKMILTSYIVLVGVIFFQKYGLYVIKIVGRLCRGYKKDFIILIFNIIV